VRFAFCGRPFRQVLVILAWSGNRVSAAHAAPFCEQSTFGLVRQGSASFCREQQSAGHWGVPLMVFEGEPFFGQDRFETLKWRMVQKGLKRRTWHLRRSASSFQSLPMRQI
jgi:hypothetical protein